MVLQPFSVLIWKYKVAQEDDTGKQLNAVRDGRGKTGEDEETADCKQLKLVKTKHRICIDGNTQNDCGDAVKFGDPVSPVFTYPDFS